MDRKHFEQYVKEGIEVLPCWVHTKLENVAFLVDDVPTKLQKEENGLDDNETLFGLYEGVPLSERGNTEVLMPDRITIFMKPILETYQNEDDVRACVHNTIWHEVAHHFGHGEEWVEEEEIRRGKTR